MSRLKDILEFDLDSYGDNIKKRLCLEVPCVVDLSQCNVITWFERQVEKKLKKNNRKWSVYRDKPTVLKFLGRRGAFLYDKYLKDCVRNLKIANQRFTRYMVWVEILGNYTNNNDDDGESSSTTEDSIITIFDTTSLLNQFSLIPTYSQASISVGSAGSYLFEHDLDKIITSTQEIPGGPWCS